MPFTVVQFHLLQQRNTTTIYYILLYICIYIFYVCASDSLFVSLVSLVSLVSCMWHILYASQMAGRPSRRLPAAGCQAQLRHTHTHTQHVSGSSQSSVQFSLVHLKLAIYCCCFFFLLHRLSLLWACIYFISYFFIFPSPFYGCWCCRTKLTAIANRYSFCCF